MNIFILFLSAAYAKKRPKLRKKNDAEKKTLKDAISHYNKIVGYCSSTSGHTSVTESDVLAKNALWESYEGDNDFIAYSCAWDWTVLKFFFSRNKMEAVEVYNKVQRYREDKHQTENEIRSYLDFYKVSSEKLKKEADDLQSIFCSGKYSN